jgi:Protein of unknown function (DUF3626)
VASPAQTNALEHVRKRADSSRAHARERITALLSRVGLEPSIYPALLRLCQESARVTLNFHPDRPTADGLTVVEKLLSEGQYRSQFVTGISNGSRTAFAGGERDLWEAALFGGAYHEPRAPVDERPRYGGLDVMGHADGACPRFGSCYFELHAHMVSRCTFTWGDSHVGAEHVGTIDSFEPVLAALLESVEATGEALGVTGLDVSSLSSLLASVQDPARRGSANRSPGRALDAYIEAQIHSEIDLSRDVKALFIDPAFEGTPTGEQLHSLCAKHGIALWSHPGFVLAASEVPDDFRGPRLVPLAARLEERFARASGELDAFVVGRAAQSLFCDPEAWSDWGTAEEALQHLKQMWHVLVRYGHPRSQRR